jgi:hypothetical protein
MPLTKTQQQALGRRIAIAQAEQKYRAETNAHARARRRIGRILDSRGISENSGKSRAELLRGATDKRSYFRRITRLRTWAFGRARSDSFAQKARSGVAMADQLAQNLRDAFQRQAERIADLKSQDRYTRKNARIALGVQKPGKSGKAEKPGKSGKSRKRGKSGEYRQSGHAGKIQVFRQA